MLSQCRKRLLCITFELGILAFGQVPLEEREQRVKDFVKRMGFKGPVFEISALSHEGCPELVNAIYKHLEETRKVEHRAEETTITEEARAIHSIDADDPRFKVID